MTENHYISFIAEVKQQILQSRYQAARLVNREQLLLYFVVGKQLAEKVNTEKWGTKVIEQIAEDLQKELPGLKGFSYRNLKNMRQFADEYSAVQFLPLITAITGQMPSAQLQNTDNQKITISQMPNLRGLHLNYFSVLVLRSTFCCSKTYCPMPRPCSNCWAN